jgi:hypothetical protein
MSARLETRLSSVWKRKQLFTILLLGGFSVWFYYDATVGFPAKVAAFDKYAELQQADRLSEWDTIARSNRWDRKPPERRKTKSDIGFQYTFCGVFGVLSVVSLVWFIRSTRQHLYAEDGVIHATNGAEVPYSAVKRTDRRKWDSKGIAYAFYESEAGAGRITLDDYKFEGAEAILLEVEAKLGITPAEPAPLPDSVSGTSSPST